MKKTDTIVDLTRSMYKELKSMNREQMQQVLANIYKKGVKSVKQGSVDVHSLRTEIGKINGTAESGGVANTEIAFFLFSSIHITDLPFLTDTFTEVTSE